MSKKVYYAGMDLHSNNVYCGIVDAQGKRVLGQRWGNDLPAILSGLKPYRKNIRCIALESTFNWYWLADGLMDAGYDIKLANPLAMGMYSAKKVTNDKTDAFWIAELLRLGILPTGYIFDRQTRGVRDLLRRRMLLVQLRTSTILSWQGLYQRHTGKSLTAQKLKSLTSDEAADLFDGEMEKANARLMHQQMEYLTQGILEIEQTALPWTHKIRSFKSLLDMPGIGKTLGLVITLETGDPKRFPNAGHYASYCRCVEAKAMSNDKPKGLNNSKCGNKYLSWAFVEAAHHARLHSDKARQYFDRKAARSHKIIAIKSLAAKLAKAAWHVMRYNLPFDENKLFN